MAANPRFAVDEQLPFTAQDDFFDALVRHQVFLGRFSNGVTQQAADILNNDETFFRAVIFERIKSITQAPSVANLSKSDRMIREMIDKRQESWTAIRALWMTEYRAMMREEVAFADIATKRSVPFVELDTDIPPRRTTNSLLTQTRYEGRTLAGWLINLQRSDAAIIATTMNTSVAQGLGPVAASRALVGTRSAQGRNGALQTIRNHLATVSRTSTTALAGASRASYWTSNAELFDGERFTAVLDGHTTPICRATDGEQHPIGEGPMPPLHMNCRSLRTPILDGEIIGRRNSTPSFERRTLREFAQANNIRPIPTTRAALPYGTKGKFDAFRQKKNLALVGTEPLSVTYQQWLSRQPAQFQDDVLGVTRGKLFRKGGLSLDKMVDGSGNTLTLNQLAKKDAAAFDAAGLDPSSERWANLERGANPGPTD